MLEQAALADFIADGHLERHIRRMRRLYKRRREVLVDALARHFRAGATVLGDAAGMHLVVRFDDPRIEALARRRGVELASTARYYMSDPPVGEFLIRFSSLSERAIREAIRRLAGAV
jgi:GntR family transcriptional regulator/MocR family aminotransferase